MWIWLSPQVSLDSRVRETVNRNMADPTIHTFDEAQQQIYILMHRDSFPRFLNSKMFRRMVENASREKKWGAPSIGRSDTSRPAYSSWLLVWKKFETLMMTLWTLNGAVYWLTLCRLFKMDDKTASAIVQACLQKTVPCQSDITQTSIAVDD